ncbi:MAG: hypothetical protein AMJ79_06335, partial [Phycisphaerae bacterium SM23_30]
MINHEHHNNLNPPHKSSPKACLSVMQKIASSSFLQRWGWTAGILGCFLIAVVALWHVTVSRAAPDGPSLDGTESAVNNQLGHNQTAQKEPDVPLSELVAQIQELITVLKENDTPAYLTAQEPVRPENQPSTATEPSPEEHFSRPNVAARKNYDVENNVFPQSKNDSQTLERKNNERTNADQQQKIKDPNETVDQQKKTAEDVEIPDNLTDEERKLFELFERYAAAVEEDPDSAEALELSRQLDVAFEEFEKRMVSDPNISLEKPPSNKIDAKTQKTKTAEPPVRQQETGENIAPPVTKQQATKTVTPPVKQQAEAKNITPPVKQQQEAKTLTPPVKQQTATETVIPPLKQQAAAKTITPPVNQQAATKTITPPTEQQQAAQTKRDLDRQVVAAGAQKPPVIEDIVAKTTQPPVEIASSPAEVPKPIPSPNDIVQITVEDFQLDIEMLIELIGKEFELNFIYHDETGVAGKVRFQQYGEVQRRDLLPLLESLLQFKNYTMVRDGSVIHIVQRNLVDRQTEPLLAIGTEMPEITPGDAVLTQIIEIRNTSVSNLLSLLSRFVSNPQSLIQIPNTNHIIITEFAKRMPRLLEIIKLSDQDGPPRKLEALTVKYITTQQAIAFIRNLLNELDSTTPDQPAQPPQPSDRGRPQPTQPTTTPVAAARGISFYEDTRTGRIFVIGTDDQIEQVKSLLEIIDIEQLGADIKLVSLPVVHIAARDAITQVNALLRSINELRGAGASTTTTTPPTLPQDPRQRQANPPQPQSAGTVGLTKVTDKGPFMHEQERLNRIFVVGLDEQIDQIKELLALLDVPAGPEIKLDVLYVKNVPVQEVLQQINELVKALNEKGGSTAPDSGQPPQNLPRNQLPPGTPPRQATSAQPSTGIESQGAFILSDEKNLRFLVVGSDEQINQIKELLALLDVVEGPEIKLVPLPVRNVPIAEIKGQIDELLKALNETGASAAPAGGQPPANPSRGDVPARPSVGTSQPAQAGGGGSQGPYIFTDERNARLLVVGSDAQIDQIKELLALLDVVEGPQIRLEIMHVYNVPAREVVGQILELLKALNETGVAAASAGSTSGQPAPIRPTGQTRVSDTPPAQTGTIASQVPVIISDERNARLLVVGSDSQIEQVKELLTLLDVVEGPEIKLVPLRVYNVPASELKGQIEELLQALNETTTTATATSASEVQTQIRSGTNVPQRSLPTGGLPGAQASRAAPTGPYIFADERNARLLIVGSDAQIEQVKELLALLDVVEGPEIKLVTLRVRYVPIPDVVDQIRDLLDALNKSITSSTTTADMRSAGSIPTGLPQSTLPPTRVPGAQTAQAGPTGTYIFPDERNMRLLVVGSEDQINQVKELLALLDVVEGPEIKLEVLRVQHVPIPDIQQQLQDLLEVLNETVSSSASTIGPAGIPTAARSSAQPAMQTPQASGAFSGQLGSNIPQVPYIFGDERNLRLLVVGSEDQIQQVRELLTLLDVVEGPEIKLIDVRIQHVWADEIAQQLNELLLALNERELPTTFTGQSSSSGFGGRSTAGADLFPGETGRGIGREGQTERTSQSLINQPGKVGPTGAFLLVDAKTNRLLIVGSQEQIDQIIELLVVLDVPPNERNKLNLWIYPAQYVEVTEIERILNQLGLTQTSEQAPYRERIGEGTLPAAGTSQIIQSEPAAGAAEPIGTLVAGPEGQTVTGGPQEPEIRIAIQETTNRIFILATEYQLLDIKEIISQVDIDQGELLGAAQIYYLENQEPTEVKNMLDELFEAEREIQGVDQTVHIPGKPGAPIIVAFDKAYAIAVQASKKDQEKIKALIEILDKRPAQVLVEAVLVQVSASESLKLGIGLQQKWDVGGLRSGTRTLSGISPFGFAPALSASGIVSGEGAVLAFFDDDLVFATLEAMQDQSDTKIVSKPRILVNDNEVGTIVSQRQEPKTKFTIAGAGMTPVPVVEFAGYEDAGTTLTITPHISEGD